MFVASVRHVSHLPFLLIRNPVGLDVFDDKDGPSKPIMAFGTLVSYPKPRADIDGPIARVRTVLDAQSFADSSSATVNLGPLKSSTAVARPGTALSPDETVSRETAFSVRTDRLACIYSTTPVMIVDLFLPQHARAQLATMVLPFRSTSAVTVVSLGTIKPGVWACFSRVLLHEGVCVCPFLSVAGYYNDRYIWPVGFKSTRLYNSYIDVDARVEYTSEILDGGDSGPIFKVIESASLSYPTSLTWIFCRLAGDRIR